VAALRRTRGKIYGEDGAARLLGIKPTTLLSRLASSDSSRLVTSRSSQLGSPRKPRAHRRPSDVSAKHSSQPPAAPQLRFSDRVS